MRRLDVLFVHPNASKDIYQKLSDNYSAIEPPIWAMMLAGNVRKYGYSAAILDSEAEHLTPKQTAISISEHNPKLVVIVVYGQQPSASTQNMQGVKYICDEMNKSYPEYKILLTGLYPSACSRKSLEDEKATYICQGEGPQTILGLLKSNMNDVSQLKKIPGLWYRDENNNICYTKPASVIPQGQLEIEMPSLSWDLISMDRYRTATWHSMTNNNNKEPFAAVYTSLGCPYKCTFCCINAPFGNNNLENSHGRPSFRYWDPKFIIKEFDIIANMGIKNVKIADEMFVLNKNHFLKLCKLIAERGYDFNIWAYSRIDTVKAEYLKVLKDAGVNWLGLGIESGNRVVRQDVIKGKFKEIDIADICKKIEDAGIEVAANYIFGLPEDNYETMKETLNLSLEINSSMSNFYSAMAYPGSTLYLEAIKNDWELPKTYSGYSQHSYDCTPLPTNFISNKGVLEFRDKAFNLYYTNKLWIDKIEKKFGKDTIKIYKDMIKHKLKRLILGD